MGSKEKKNRAKINLALLRKANSLDRRLTLDAMRILMRGLASFLLLLAMEAI